MAVCFIITLSCEERDRINTVGGTRSPREREAPSIESGSKKDAQALCSTWRSPRCATPRATPLQHTHTASRSRPPTAPQRRGYKGTCFFFSRPPTKCCCPGASGLLTRLPAAADALSCSAPRTLSHRATACDHPCAVAPAAFFFCRGPAPACSCLFGCCFGCECPAAAAAHPARRHVLESRRRRRRVHGRYLLCHCSLLLRMLT